MAAPDAGGGAQLTPPGAATAVCPTACTVPAITPRASSAGTTTPARTSLAFLRRVFSTPAPSACSRATPRALSVLAVFVGDCQYSSSPRQVRLGIAYHNASHFGI